MTVPAGRVPILDSVGGAMRTWRREIRLHVVAGLIGAAALTALSLLSVVVAGNQSIAFLVMTLATVVGAYIYTTFLSVDLKGAAGLAARLPGEGWRVWCALAVVGFFLFIVFVVALIPGVVLLFTALAPYEADLTSAGQDQAAVLAVIQRFAAANIMLLLIMALIYGAILLLLTSRLYLAAPATVGANRILSVETWSWTKNNMLRIAGTRLMLLTPASILVFAAQALIGGVLGVNVLDPTSLQAAMLGNPAGYGVVVFCGHVVNFTLYRGLEAALSARLYQSLRPAS